MKDNFDDKLAQKIRESLENYPVEFDPSAWADLQKSLQAVPSVSVPFWKTLPFRMAASVVLVVSVGLACYWGLSSDEPSETTKLTASNSQKNDSMPKIETQNANKTVAKQVLETNLEKDSANKSANKLENYLPKNTALETQKPKQTNISKQPKAVFPKQTETPNQNTNQIPVIALSVKKQDEQPKDLANIQSEVPRMEATELVLQPNLIRDLAKNLAFEKPQNIKAAILPKTLLETQSNPKQKLEIRFLAGIGTSAGATFGKNVEGTSFNYGGGLHTDLLLGKKIAISSGFQITQISYETPLNVVYIDNPFRVSNLFPNINSEVSRQIAQQQHTSVQWQIFQIPLTVKYFASRNVFINAGFLSYFLGKNSNYQKITDDKIEGEQKSKIYEPSQRNFHPFAIAYVGAGFQKTFSNFTLQIEPYMSLPLQEIGNANGASSFSWAGLSLRAYFGSNTSRAL